MRCRRKGATVLADPRQIFEIVSVHRLFCEIISVSKISIAVLHAPHPVSVGNQGELWERHAQKSLENQAPVTDIHSFFINSPTKEHLGCLWVLEIMNKVVINIQVQLFVWTYIFKSVG